MAAKSLLFLTAVWTVIAEVPSLLEETIKRNPPTNIQISFGSFGEYTLSWDGNCTCEGNIYYQLDYKYLDSNDSKFDSFYLQVHRKKMNLELHRGIFAQVKLLYSEDNNAEISSNWTQGTFNLPRNSFASVYNLTCIFYGNMWMNCTWEIYNDGPEDAQYHLSYRKMHSNNLYNCSNYLVAGGRNIGCVGHKYDLALSYELIVCISEMNNKTKLPHCRRLQPSSFHKLDNPINVKINKSTDVVTWKLPEVNYNPICYKFQLNITNWSNGDQKVENVSATKYVISRDQTKKYSLQVRVLMNDKCLESTIWSDWSKPLIIGLKLKMLMKFLHFLWTQHDWHSCMCFTTI
ncbi:interleukin-5 receptor subunit alpha-like isoform X2 [Narcine bancroftii]|uniref:interleukin-5 receptor subunit alpha-like isoform X2 n=1 Tax=Narcine bancroftii TaxID=1343680 RepID=UPI0038313AC0